MIGKKSKVKYNVLGEDKRREFQKVKERKEVAIGGEESKEN